MIDNNCIHVKVCDHVGFAVEDCSRCQFREYSTLNTNQQILEVNKFLRALEAHGSDVCDHYDYGLVEALHGYSYSAIQEVVESCQEHAEEVVGVCIEHEWAEEYEDRLISNFECPYCHEWHRNVDMYCSHCGKPIKIVHKPREKR
jgi:hypothetical protein